MNRQRFHFLPLAEGLLHEFQLYYNKAYADCEGRGIERNVMYYNIEVWGCQMSEHDAETLAGMIEAMGYKRTDNSDEADLVVLHTCCVREKAEAKVLGRIGVLKKRKKDNPDFMLAVGGCMTQQKPVAEYVQRNFENVDIIFGTHNIHRFPELLEKAKRNQQGVLEVFDACDGVIETLPAAREDKIKAYVNIIYGCNNFCTYCIVPHVRGRERSREMEHIVAEVEGLLAKGYKDIMLLGQNVNSYGKTLPEKPDFSDLLLRLDSLCEYRLRYMTSHPRDFSDKLIDTIAMSRNVCEQFHLPLQSGSDRIIRLMHRGYTKDGYLDTIEKIYQRFDDPVLTTDIIVGFPGETEEDFEHTLDVVKKARYDQAFTFLYSPREGTPAAQMKEQVPHDVKMERFNRLLMLQNQISYEKNQAMLGKTVEILVEGPSKTSEHVLTGRTRGGKVVNFPGRLSDINTLKRVTIREAKTWSLFGEINQGE